MTQLHSQAYLEFVARLRRSRKAAGVTQAQLARRLGRAQSYVSKAETCERRLDFIETAQWCHALRVRLADVLPSEFRSVLEQ